MVTEKTEYLKEVLVPKEVVVFDANISGSFVMFPILLMIFGGLTLIPWKPQLLFLPTDIANIIKQGHALLQEAFFGIILFLAGFSITVKHMVAKRNNIQVLTNYRVLVRTGFWKDHTNYLPLQRIDYVKVKGNIFEKLLSTGKIQVMDKQKEWNIVLHGVAKPKEFKEAVKKAVAKFTDQAELAVKEGKVKEQKRKIGDKPREEAKRGVWR